MEIKKVYEEYKKLKVPSLSEIRDTASKYSKTSLLIVILLVLLLALALQYIPHYQVAQFNITNQKDLADAENSYRATLAQVFGGIAIAIGIYYTWRRITIAEEDLKATQKNLEVAQESQITERFTRAVDQLGNQALEIRLGGIYALERIANESDKDYWPIMEILTAYIRKNSRVDVIENKNVTLLAIDIQANESKQKEDSETKKVALDIQAVLTVLGRREKTFYDGESNRLNLSHSRLQATYLEKAHLEGANLEGANLEGANLEGANLEKTHLEEADLWNAHLEGAYLFETHLQKANLGGAYLERADLVSCYLVEADLVKTHLEEADLRWTHLEAADLVGAYLIKANLEEAHLEGSYIIEANLTEANLKGAYLGKVEFEELEPYVISSKEDDGIRLIAVGEKTDYEDFFDDELKGANLASANLTSANLTNADLSEVNLPRADLSKTNFSEAKLERTNFKGAKNLTVDQLSKAKTLYQAQLDPELEAELRAKGFGHLLDNEPE